ncbi:MAG TPA: hypothetical protein VK256_12390 [Candidatus Eisenbacteria bacterium]|nr:hypothetical protein [Candidatus Eisenbacteria bacterium]
MAITTAALASMALLKFMVHLPTRRWDAGLASRVIVNLENPDDACRKAFVSC